MKLYQVSLYSQEDGGRLLGQASFHKAKDARDEFLRVRENIFEGFDYEWNKLHFTHYETDSFWVHLGVVETENHIELPLSTEKPYDLLPVYTDENYKTSICNLFKYWVGQVRPWDYKSGYKRVYNGISHRVGEAILDVEYRNKSMIYTIFSKTGVVKVTVKIGLKEATYSIEEVK